MDNHLNILGLALPKCARCKGTGQSADRTCLCVYREAFRETLKRFRALREGRPRPTGLEFCADFFLVARRALEPPDRSVFKLYLLAGADHKLCYQRLGIERGRFYHAVYRIEAKLGKAFMETKPFPLWPVRDYFHNQARHAQVQAFPGPAERYANGIPLRPPLAKPSPSPVPVAQVVVEPVPVPAPVVLIPSPVPLTAANVATKVRAYWREGASARAIARRLNTAGVAGDSGRWTTGRVRALIIQPVQKLAA